MRYLVLGQGKSGTTALYEAICRAAMKPVESVFEPKRLRDVSLKQAESSGSTVAKVLIEHVEEEDEERFGCFDKVVFICRDPRDVMISRLLYRVRDLASMQDPGNLEEFLEVLRRKESDPGAVSTTYMFNLLGRLAGGRNQLGFLEKVHGRAVDMWDRHGGMVHLLRYEDFVGGDANAISSYLGLDVSSDVKVRRRYRRVERTRSSGDWKNWFTAEDREVAWKMFHRYMERFEYLDWSEPRERYISPEFGSEYVKRIVEERRA